MTPQRSEILLVDDREENLVAMEALLAEEDAVPLRARSGAEALELLLQHEVAVAIIDVQMPEMDGLELAELMRGKARTRDIPIVFVTAGLHDDQRILRAYETGAVDFLLKPIEPVILRSKVRTFLHLHQARQQLALQVAELRRAESALKEASRRKDEFLALLGHELRNPLSAIAMANAAIEKTCAACGVSSARRSNDIVRRQTRQLTRLVDDLLDVGRVTAGKLTLQRAVVDVRLIVQTYLAGLDATVRGQGLELHAPPPGAPILVNGDAARIEQIVANLVGNATKFTPPGGRIDVDVEESDGRAILRVRDDGVGIPPDMLEEIFGLFTQAHADVARQRGGLGIGLTLVRMVTHLHGGDVTVTSPGPGRGSEFVVRLPLADRAQAPVARRAAPSEAAPALRLLVVEDNPDALESLRDVFEIDGHRVETASEGLAAVERALAVRPDVAFIDIGLPGIDGYEVARRIRAALGGAIYLVALTGYGQPEDKKRALESGFDSHVTKPPLLEQLQEILSRVAGRARQARG